MSIGRAVWAAIYRANRKTVILARAESHSARANFASMTWFWCAGVPGVPGYPIWIQVVFSSVYLSIACSDLSRPLPDCLTPPNGTVMSSLSY